MAKATTTTYLEIESIGADKLVSTMAGLQKSMNFVAGQLKDLNRGLGLSTTHAKKGAEAMTEQAQAAAIAAQQATQLRVAMAQQMATTADLAKTVKSLGEEQKKQSKALDWQAVASKVQLARQAYEAIKGVLVSVGQEAMRLAQAWQVQEQAEMTLQALLQTNPMQGQIASYKEWAGAIQKATVYGDEQVIMLAAMAGRFTKNEADTKAATKAALDYAAATGGDAAEAIRSIGRGIVGQTRALQTLGLYLTEAEQKQLKEATQAEKTRIIIEKLTERFGGFAEALATTPTGALQQAKNLLGDIDEQVGRLVSPALYAGLSVINDYLQGQKSDILAITDDAEQLKAVQNSILVGLATAAGTLIDIKTALLLAKNAVEILGGALWTALSAPLKPVGMLLDFFSGLPGLGQATKQALGDLAYAISAPFDMAVDGIKSDVADIHAELKAADKLKDQVWQGLERGMTKYQAAAKKRQEAAGLGQKPQGVATTTPATPSAPLAPVEPDKELALMESYMAKLEAATAEFAAKRKAIEDSVLIDYQTKLDYKKELDKQEQEQLRTLKLQYAQETGDQLTLIEDQYRQERMAKEAEAAKALEAEQTAVMTKLADNLKQVSGLGVDMLTGWIEGTGDWRAQLYDALKSFSKNLMTTAIASIIDQALVNQSKAQGSQAGIPIVGPILALAAGAAMFATTMALKSKLKPAEVKYAQGGYISAGMVRGGAWGRDSVPALLEPGERVLSKKETEAYDSAQSRAVVQNITVNINGQLSTPAQITDTVRRVLVPELKAAARAGYAI